MNNYYLRYNKTENAKYVSHLDFVRMFGRAMRRAHFPIAYSEGFNPHPLLTFALPLSVGYTSGCELLEFVLTEHLSCEEIKTRINEVLPMGVEITEVFEGRSNMKKLDLARYSVYPEKTPSGVKAFMELKEIIIEKKTKSGIKECDIRPDIREITVTLGKIDMLLSAGSRANLKPEVVIKAMNKYIDGYTSGDCRYHREAIYDGEENII